MSEAAQSWAPEVIEVTVPRFTPERVRVYGELTQDLNPIHVNDAFAAGSRFGRTIVHGLFVMAPVWLALEAAVGAQALRGMAVDIRFISPVFVGTSPSYRVVLETADAERARYLITVISEAGLEAITGAAIIAKRA